MDKDTGTTATVNAEPIGTSLGGLLGTLDTYEINGRHNPAHARNAVTSLTAY